ncbi:MAG: hypothetical protein J6Y36_00415 [Treponema sp.]|nr:hypothetical protein [Treponema sp.]
MNKELITPVLIESKIFVIRGKQVMIDRDRFKTLKHYVSEHVLKTDDKAEILDYIKINASKNVQIALGKYFNFSF